MPNGKNGEEEDKKTKIQTEEKKTNKESYNITYFAIQRRILIKTLGCVTTPNVYQTGTSLLELGPRNIVCDFFFQNKRRLKEGRKGI